MTKHVESLLAPCLDEGSSPSISTKHLGPTSATAGHKTDKPLNFNELSGFFVSYPIDSGPMTDLKKTAPDAHSLPNRYPNSGKSKW